MSHEMERANPFIPRRVPKMLKKQAADRIALYIIQGSLPAIEICFEKVMDEQDEFLRRQMLRRLKQLKTWYWEETDKWLGHKVSSTRCSIGNSLMDVLDWKKAYKRCPPLHRFVIQILFGCEAGLIERWPEMDIDSRVCHQLVGILKFMAPFNLYGLHDTCLRYGDSSLFSTIVKNSPNLRHIHLFFTSNATCLQYIRRKCTKLEVITIDIENVIVGSYKVLDQNLFKTFFENMSKDDVMENVQKGESILRISFPFLKEVCIRYDILPAEILKLMFCIHFYYPEVKTTLKCLVGMPYDSIQKKLPFISPSFSVKKNLESKQVFVYFMDDRFVEAAGEHSNFLAGSLEVSNVNYSFCENVQRLQREMLKLSADSLIYLYYSEAVISITPTIHIQGETLRELYLYGIINNNANEDLFVQMLHRCVNLKVLCLHIKIKCMPSVRKFQFLKNLDILTIGFDSFTSFKYTENLNPWTPVADYMKTFLTLLITAAPNLVLLEIPGMDNLMHLLELESFSKIHTLSITEGRVDILKPCVSGLPSLSVLMLSRDFGYRKYLEMKKAFKCTDLKVVLKKGRLVHPFTFENSNDK